MWPPSIWSVAKRGAHLTEEEKRSAQTAFDEARQAAQDATIAATKAAPRRSLPLASLSGESHRAEPRPPAWPTPTALPTDARPDSRVSSISNLYEQINAAKGQLGRYPPHQIYGMYEKLNFNTEDLRGLPLAARTARNWRYFHYRNKLEREITSLRGCTRDASEDEQLQVRRYRMNKVISFGSRPTDHPEMTHEYLSADDAAEQWNARAKNDIQMKKDLGKRMLELIRHNREFHAYYSLVSKTTRIDYCVSVDYLRCHPLMCTEFCLLQRQLILMIVTEDEGQRLRTFSQHGLQMIGVRDVSARKVDTSTVSILKSRLLNQCRWPTECVYGTTIDKVRRILKHGVIAGGPQENRGGGYTASEPYIHFAVTSLNVQGVVPGIPPRSTVLIKVDFRSAMQHGFEFYHTHDDEIATSGNVYGILPKTFFLDIQDITDLESGERHVIWRQGMKDDEVRFVNRGQH